LEFSFEENLDYVKKNADNIVLFLKNELSDWRVKNFDKSTGNLTFFNISFPSLELIKNIYNINDLFSILHNSNKIYKLFDFLNKNKEKMDDEEYDFTFRFQHQNSVSHILPYKHFQQNIQNLYIFAIECFRHKDLDLFKEQSIEDIKKEYLYSLTVGSFSHLFFYVGFLKNDKRLRWKNAIVSNKDIFSLNSKDQIGIELFKLSYEKTYHFYSTNDMFFNSYEKIFRGHFLAYKYLRPYLYF
jgi:hypothetical protein